MLPNHPSHLFPTQPSFSSLSAFHSALPGWYRITPCLISVDPREGTGQSGDTGPGKAQGRPAETIVLMPETNASALKRRGPDEPDNEPDVKRPAASKTTASPSNVVGAAAGGFGAVAGGACTWGTGGGASFGGFAGAAATGGGFGGGFAGAATAAGGGFGGVFAGAAAASAGGGGFGAAAVLSAAAPTEKKEPVLATFGQREATTETPVSAEPAPSEDGAPTPAPTLAPSEATQSGEEDEVCIHKVRAKLFRLETRPKVVAESIPNKDDDDDDDDDDDESAPAAAATAVAPAAAPAAAPTTEPEPKPAAGALAGAAAAAEAWGSGVEAGEGGGAILWRLDGSSAGWGRSIRMLRVPPWWRHSWLPWPPGRQGSGSGLPYALLEAREGFSHSDRSMWRPSACVKFAHSASRHVQVKLLMPKGGGEEDSTARLVMRVENVRCHVKRGAS